MDNVYASEAWNDTSGGGGRDVGAAAALGVDLEDTGYMGTVSAQQQLIQQSAQQVRSRHSRQPLPAAAARCRTRQPAAYARQLTIPLAC